MKDTIRFVSKPEIWVTSLVILFFGIAWMGIQIDRDTPRPPMSYQLSNGKVVTCKDLDSFNCGMKFTECEDGYTYRCQTNVIQLTK